MTQLDLTTYIVDDDQAARDSLTFLLRAEGIRCRAFASAHAFLDQILPEHRGCIITDVRMPEMDGIALVNALQDRGCRIPVIVITGHADVSLAVEAMKAGAVDFIEKPFEGDQILHAVRHCLELSHEQEAQETRRLMVLRRMAMLTERERQVCDAVIEGDSNREIAAKLAISPRTVEIYRANVMSKMQAGSVSELVRMMLATRAA